MSELSEDEAKRIVAFWKSDKAAEAFAPIGDNIRSSAIVRGAAILIIAEREANVAASRASIALRDVAGADELVAIPADEFANRAELERKYVGSNFFVGVDDDRMPDFKDAPRSQSRALQAGEDAARVLVAVGSAASPVRGVTRKHVLVPKGRLGGPTTERLQDDEHEGSWDRSVGAITVVCDAVQRRDKERDALAGLMGGDVPGLKGGAALWDMPRLLDAAHVIADPIIERGGGEREIREALGLDGGRGLEGAEW